jgi:hypothetical protein
MSGTNPVATYRSTDYTVDTPTNYKTGIDSNFIVLKRTGSCFAPRQSNTPAMTVTLDPGFVFIGVTLTEVATQTTTTITAPIGNPRIDRIVVDRLTGAYTIVTGTPAGSPVAPAIPSGKLPVCQVLLQTSSTVITNSMITDERALNAIGQGTIAELNQSSVILTDGSGNATIGTNTVTNAMLSQMTNLRIQSNISGSTANASGNTLTAILDAIMGSTRGAILTRGASNWSLLAPGAAGTFLKSFGTGADLAYAAPTGGLQSLAPQTFTTSGTYTPSAGMVYCFVKMVGGGGGGGASSGGSNQGNGGGAGGYSEILLTAAAVGGSQTVTIGAKGNKGTAGSNGSDGGTSSFGSILTCTGGAGGWAGNNANKGGAGGTGSGGDKNITGQGGGNITGLVGPGDGGSSPFGFGGRAKAAAGAGNSAQANSGAGGSGGYGGTGNDGGDGGDGFCIITEFIA